MYLLKLLAIILTLLVEKSLVLNIQVLVVPVEFNICLCLYVAIIFIKQ